MLMVLPLFLSLAGKWQAGCICRLVPKQMWKGVAREKNRAADRKCGSYASNQSSSTSVQTPEGGKEHRPASQKKQSQPSINIQGLLSTP